jgi:hypothetical protein
MLVATTSHVEDCPDLGPQCNQALPPKPYRHHIALFMDETAVDASYGLASWAAIEARFAVRVADVRPSYFELDGTPKTVVNDIHHRRETLVGPADPWLLARAGASTGKLVTAARLGVTLPIGNTVPDPYIFGREGLPHEHIQFGTGTFVPIVGGGLTYTTTSVVLSVAALGFFNVYENGDGFRAPMRAFGTTRAAVPLPALKFRPYVALDFAHEGRERWHGVDGAESYIRNDLLGGGGIEWEFAKDWQVEVGARARLVTFSSGVVLDYPGTLSFGVSSHFDVASHQ